MIQPFLERVKMHKYHTQKVLYIMNIKSSEKKKLCTCSVLLITKLYYRTLEYIHTINTVTERKENNLTTLKAFGGEYATHYCSCSFYNLSSFYFRILWN